MQDKPKKPQQPQQPAAPQNLDSLLDAANAAGAAGSDIDSALDAAGAEYEASAGSRTEMTLPELGQEWQTLSPEQKQATYDGAGAEAGLVGTIASVPAAVGGVWQGAKAMAQGAPGVTKALSAALSGYRNVRHPFAYAAQQLLRSAGNAAPAAEEAVMGAAPKVAQTAAPEAIDYTKLLTQGMNTAGKAGRAESQGNAAMSRGIERASEMGSKAGRAANAARTVSKGMIGAGKVAPAATPFLGGFSPEMDAQPAPPQLSTDTGQAKMQSMMALKQGLPRAAVEQQLRSQYDPATVAFVLAALPNRLPQ